jgi:hypothetical protein
MQPIVHGLEIEFAGQLAFERRDANTEAGRVTMQTYHLLAHPSYVIVTPAGKQLWSSMGPVSAERLRTQLQTYSKGVP